ncbi:unnamed protein product [Alternaria alternata]
MPPISLRMLPHTRATLMAYSRRITPQREFAKPLTVLLRLSISPILTSPPMMLVPCHRCWACKPYQRGIHSRACIGAFRGRCTATYRGPVAGTAQTVECTSGITREGRADSVEASLVRSAGIIAATTVKNVGFEVVAAAVTKCNALTSAVDEVPVDEETVVVPNDEEEDVGKEVDDSVLLVVDEALLLADVLEPLEVDVMLVDDDSDDDESVLLAVDDEILLNDELESLDVGITLLDDSDPVLLFEVVGMLLDELNEVLVNETLELLSEADDVLLLELSEEVLLLMELEVSDELEEELLERLSEEVVEDIELVGVALDEELGELSVLLVIGFSSEVVEELLDAVDEVPEVVGSSIVDELPELEDAVVDAVETDVEELKELKVVGVLDELLDSVGEDEELPVLDDDVVGLEEELSVLADDVAELEEGPLVLVDDNVLEITLLVTLLDNEEDVCVLDEIGELAEDEGVNTGHDVPVVEILVMVVVAVLVTVCDI